MTPEAILADLLSATRNLVARVPALQDFVGDSLARLDYTRPEPCDLPVTSQLSQLTPLAGASTAELTIAVLAAVPHLHWQQSYSEAQVGAHYLQNYGWFNLVSPEGPYTAQGVRVSVGYWAQRLSYPQHRHAPEEIYCVLAGGARFESSGAEPRETGPGDLVHHAPNQMHGFTMERAPLLAMAFWKGAGLLDFSQFEDGR